MPGLAPMSPRPCPRSTARQALRLGGLLVVLGGVLGMHGLDNHGGAGMGAVGHADMAASAHITAATHGTGYAVLAQISHEATAAAPAMTGSGGRAGRAWAWVSPGCARPPAAPGRDPDPPSLFSLSIQRC
jgi:hypothetical protein